LGLFIICLGLRFALLAGALERIFSVLKTKNKKKLPVISRYEKISNKKYQVKQNYTKNEKQKKLPVIS
jgi:hypothetical protein